MGILANDHILIHRYSNTYKMEVRVFLKDHLLKVFIYLYLLESAY